MRKQLPATQGISNVLRSEGSKHGCRHFAFHMAASALGCLPGRFGLARILGRRYSLLCIVFHDVAAAESSFTRGMGINITPSNFERVLQFIARHYNPVRLQDVLDDREGRGLPPRAVLVTFDDGYASVMEIAVPVCRRLGVPATLFLNAAFLNNLRLSPDNIVCYAANTLGMATINAAAQVVKRDGVSKLQSLMEVFTEFLPSISLHERERFLQALSDLGKINERQLATEAGLYFTSKQLRELSSDFEIGNHTHSHVHCRSLSTESFCEEIDRNKMELEILGGRPIRSFSVPYGSSTDLSSALVDHLQRSGHELIFLSEGVANPRSGHRICLDRVGPHAYSSDMLFLELEVLPRLRATRNWINSQRVFRYLVTGDNSEKVWNKTLIQ